MYAAAQSLPLKISTGFFADTAGTLAYGDEVMVLELKGKWARVRSAADSSLTGWTASSSLTSKWVAQGSGRSASAREIAIAGKGFSGEVEKEYRAGRNLNYEAVDILEQTGVSGGDLLGFINEGRLARGEQ